MKKKLKRFEELGAKFYRKTIEEEIILAQWWEQLRINGDSQHLFPVTNISLTAFLGLFNKPNVLLHYALDEEGAVKVAGWLEQANHAKEHCMYITWWANEKLRGSKEFMRYTFSILDIYTTSVPVIIAFGPRPEIAKLQRSIGFDIIGSVPMMFNGRDCNVMYITRELFEQGKMFKTGLKLIGG